MRFFRRLTAALLLALWLPAVLHCRVEGLLGVECCAEDAGSHADKGACEGDSCTAIEGGFIKPATANSTAPAPILFCLPGAPVVPTEAVSYAPLVNGIQEETVSPPDSIRLRHFAQRAALPARAPDAAS